MDYAKHYDLLIDRAMGRKLNWYYERHHILPRCMGGSDEKDNLVDLTAEEHFLAHQLLVKMYPDIHGIAYAAMAMCGNTHGKRSNKAYGWLRRAAARATSILIQDLLNDPEYVRKHREAVRKFSSTEEYKKKISKIHKGRAKSEKEIENIVAASKNRAPYSFSDQAKANISAAQKKRWERLKESGEANLIAQKTRATRIANGSYKKSDETRAKISEAQKGRVITAEQGAKISAALKGRKKSPEHVAKVAAANRSRAKPKPVLTDEEIAAKKAQKFANLSARSKGKKLQESHKEKISGGLIEAYASGKRRAPMAKLTDDQVIEIIGLLSHRIHPQKEIAKMYGVAASVISEIKLGRAYRHIQR